MSAPDPGSAPIAEPSSEPIDLAAVEVVSPLGADFAAFAAALLDGRSAIAAEPDGAPLKLAARIGEFGAKQWIPAGSLRRMPRATQLLLVAMRQLQQRHGALPYADDRIGLVVGTGLGTLEETIGFQRGYLQGGPEAASPLLFPVSVMNAPAGQIAVECGLRGVNSTINHRDASSLGALLYAVDLLRFGRADAVYVGAVDELGAVAREAWAAIGNPSAEGLRPYDRRRTGLVPGEVATLLLLERRSALAARGRTGLAHVAASAASGDVRPRLGWGAPTAWPAATASVRRVVEAAPALDWIVGGGNGTNLDEAELLVYHAALGPSLPPITSVLGQLGECMASGLARVAAALVGIGEQRILATIGCEQPIDEAIALRSAPRPLRSVLVPSFAQGGSNVVVRLEAP